MSAQTFSPDIAQPDWLLAGFDAARDLFHFARIDRATYTRSSFLDHRIEPMPSRTGTLTGPEVDEALAPIDLRPASYLFHTAFCCSTLLASCLDHESRTLVLKEPLVLSHLANWKRTLGEADAGQWTALSARVFDLTDRGYAGEAVIVKPSNFANALMPELLGAYPERRFILMSCSLRSLLLSILKKRDEAMTTLPSFLAALLQDSDYLEHVQLPAPDAMDLLQQSVVFWHCQRHHFQVIRARYGAGRCMAVTMEEFLAQPLPVLESICGFLELDVATRAIRQTVESGAFIRHSKLQGVEYNQEQRRSEAREIALRYESDLSRVMAWARPLFDAIPVAPLTEAEVPLGR